MESITQDSSKFADIGVYTGAIERVDPTTRWVFFEWVEWTEEAPFGRAPDSLASDGVIADCIRWVQIEGQQRINLV